MKRLRSPLLLAPLVGLSLTGCLLEQDRERVSVDWKSGLRNAAEDYRTAVTYENARRAFRQGDYSALERADQEVTQLFKRDATPEPKVDQAYRWAVQYARLATESRGDNSQDYARLAADKVMEVIRLDPDYNAGDRDVLNTLGYILADRGYRDEHFSEAIRLTRASLKLWDTAGTPRNPQEASTRKYQRALLAADSLAWALYKAGRYQEAYKVGAAALQDMRSVRPDLNGREAGAVLYHVGAMHRALGRESEAQKLFTEALELVPDPTTLERVKAALKEGPQDNPSSGGTSP